MNNNSMNNDDDAIQQSTSTNPTTSINMGQLLMERQKQKQQIPLMAKNSDSNRSNQVASTPANIKRLQVNKWFNSPTDQLFSPCSKKLYNKKNIVHAVHFDDDVENDENGQKSNIMDDNNDDDNVVDGGL